MRRIPASRSAAEPNEKSARSPDRMDRMPRPRTDLDGVPTAVAIVRPDGAMVYGNERLASMLGSTPAELRQGQLIDHVDRSHHQALHASLTQPETTVTDDVVLTRTDGTELVVSVTISDAEQGKETERYVAIVDLGKRRAAQVAARSAEALFRSAFDNAPIGMALLDLNG